MLPYRERRIGAFFIGILFHDLRDLADLGVGADYGEIVRKEQVSRADLLRQIYDVPLPVAVVDLVDPVVMIAEEGQKRVAEALLYYNERAGGNRAVGEHRERVVAAGKAHVARHVGDHRTGAGVAVLVVYDHFDVPDGIIGVDVLLGEQIGILAAYAPGGAEEPGELDLPAVGELYAADALGAAEGAVRVISAERRPMVIGAEIDELVPVQEQIVTAGDLLHVGAHVGEGGLYPALGIDVAGDLRGDVVREYHAELRGDYERIDLRFAREGVGGVIDELGVLARRGIDVEALLIRAVVHLEEVHVRIEGVPARLAREARHGIMLRLRMVRRLDVARGGRLGGIRGLGRGRRRRLGRLRRLGGIRGLGRGLRSLCRLRGGLLGRYITP